MYSHVLNLPSSSSTKVLHAKLVSLAACGFYEEAQQELTKVRTSWLFKRKVYYLAKDLAPYAPLLSVQLLEKKKSKSLLLAALYQSLGQTEKSVELLNTQKKFLKDPELLLYKSNVEKNKADLKLKMLNAYLDGFGLTPLTLQNKTQMPSVLNIEGKVDQSQDGPLVSILMTAYNSSTYIKASVMSLLNQTYKNIELIIVDDASSDNTPDIMNTLKQKDSRIKTIYLEENVGTYVAKTVALKHSTGVFVVCHDSDDFAHPLKIELQMKPLIEDETVVFTTSNWIRIENDGTYYARAVYPLLRLNPSSPLFRKKLVLERTGAWDLVRTGADSEFLARLKQVFGLKAMRSVKKPLTLGAHREESLMNASSTGYCAKGMSPVRLAYWEAWNSWHIQMQEEGKIPFMSNDLQRRFPAPSEIVVQKNDIVTKLLDASIREIDGNQ